MPAKSDQIAEALTTTLNDNAADRFTATQENLPNDKLDHFKELRVTCVPRSRASEMVGRGTSGRTFGIDIAVRQLVLSQADPRFAELSALVEEIFELFEPHKPAARQQVAAGLFRITKVENEPIFDPKLLSEKKLFSGVITLTIQLHD
jgi:hypothetical protein